MLNSFVIYSGLAISGYPAEPHIFVAYLAFTGFTVGRESFILRPSHRFHLMQLNMPQFRATVGGNCTGEALATWRQTVQMLAATLQIVFAALNLLTLLLSKFSRLELLRK